ncbi:MAG: hypothetical protein JXQ75_15795 [Phycisphaerae bacterium]|nr:hypothetical protein [Phycisphaerae bacterium]
MLVIPVVLVSSILISAGGVWLELPHAGAAFCSQARIFFVDPDDYMQAYRAKLVAAGQAARVRHIPDINVPNGVEMHWTAPMDYFLAGVGILFGPLSKHTDSFGYVAAWVPICLGVVYVLCMIAFMRRGFGAGPAILAGLLVVLSPAFHRVFQIGHPDHHCLLELLLLVALGAWIPRASADGTAGAPSTAAAIISGLATGLAIWVAAQALFLWLALVVGLTYACLSGPPHARRIYADARFAWNCATGVVVVVGFFIENWPGLNVVAVDKISTVHVALVVIAFLAPARLGSLRAATKPRSKGAAVKEQTPPVLQSQTNRDIIFLAAIAVFVIWMGLARSRAFEYVSGSKFFRWHEHIAELQPLYTRTLTDWSVQPMHDRLGLLPYALPVLLLLFLLSKQVPRPVKCALGLLAPTVMILTVVQRRWLDHINLAVTPVVVVGMWELAKALLGKVGSRIWTMRFLLTAAALAVLIYPSARIVTSLTYEAARLANRYQERTDFVAQQIAAYEIGHPCFNPRRRAILCEEGEGPMLLYCTGLPVVAVPYHRALDGVIEVARFYAERDPAEARSQLDRLGVRYVVMPPRAHEQLMHFEEMAFGKLRSFDLPTETINEFGHIMQKLNYKPHEVSQTMAYRLVMEPGGDVIPDVERIAEIQEGARTPDGTPMKTGLLYVVNELPPDDTPSTDE